MFGHHFVTHLKGSCGVLRAFTKGKSNQKQNTGAFLSLMTKGPHFFRWRSSLRSWQLDSCSFGVAWEDAIGEAGPGSIVAAASTSRAVDRNGHDSFLSMQLEFYTYLLFIVVFFFPSNVEQYVTCDTVSRFVTRVCFLLCIKQILQNLRRTAYLLNGCKSSVQS